MTSDQGQTLVRIARKTITAALGGPDPLVPEEPWLQIPGATFVTLTRHGELRGCIGTLEPRRPLAEDLRENALAAAFRDPRFPPVTAREWDSCRVEVSVLSAQTPVRFSTEEEALAALRPGTDGIVFEAGFHRATFLPQVWDQLPDRAGFLAHLKTKAGLARDYWDPQVRLYRYTVEHWQEEAP